MIFVKYLVACMMCIAPAVQAADCYGNDSQPTTISGTYKYGEQGGPWLRLDRPVLACNGAGEVALVKLWGDWKSLPQNEHVVLRGKRMMNDSLPIFEVMKEDTKTIAQGNLSPAECHAKYERHFAQANQNMLAIRSWQSDLATYMRGQGLATSGANWAALRQSLPDATVRSLAQREEQFMARANSLNEELQKIAAICPSR